MKMLQGTSLGTGAVHERPGNWDRMLHALRTRWIKDYLRDDEGGVCLLGAAYVANGTGAVSEISPYVLPMVKVIKEQFPERFETTRSGGTLHTIAYLPPRDHPGGRVDGRRESSSRVTMTRLKEGITTTGYSLMAWCRHPLAWIGPWLVGVCFTLFGMYLKADVLFLLTALLGWRPLFRMMGGWIRGRHRARSQAKRVRPDAGASTGGTGTNARARTKGAATRIAAFEGFELTVGTIYGMRAWRLHGGLLRPVHSNDAPWIAGENVADCFMTRLFEGHKAPVESCGCGFYAYTRPDTKPTLFVRGVIEGYGRTIVGTKGFRCEKARIVAFLDPRGRLSDGRALYKALRDGYPDVPIYHTQRAMLRAFPLGDE